MPKPPPHVRVRIAPSPTGEVHIGTIWIAQLNWFYAKKNGGKFILRIEDTDQKRFVPGSVERIYEGLEWIGITPDEGPQQGGDFGPYVQSERLALYKQYAEQLVAQGHAYRCFCTAERLDELRAAQAAAKQPPRYDKHCVSLSADEVAKRVAAGEPHTIRLNMPTTGTITHRDLIRGEVSFRYDLIDDSVLLKSDGFPTYHLAVVVDDHLMEINPVIRAEEWLPSVPKHLYLYQCLGWTPPEMAHVPLILGPDRSKLSKRHGATSALSYRDAGYLPEAMQNFLALMGWHPKGDEEVLSREEVIQQFELTDVNPSGAIFDHAKLDWFNAYYIRQFPADELRRRLAPYWRLPTELQSNTEWQDKAILISKDRLKKLSDISELTAYLEPRQWDEMMADVDPKVFIPKKSDAERAAEALGWVLDKLPILNDTWDSSAKLKEKALAGITAHGRKNGDVLWPLRTALSLRAASPDVFDIMWVLGRNETERRVKKVIERLKTA